MEGVKQATILMPRQTAWNQRGAPLRSRAPRLPYRLVRIEHLPLISTATMHHDCSKSESRGRRKHGSRGAEQHERIAGGGRAAERVRSRGSGRPLRRILISSRIHVSRRLAGVVRLARIACSARIIRFTRTGCSPLRVERYRTLYRCIEIVDARQSLVGEPPAERIACARGISRCPARNPRFQAR